MTQRVLVVAEQLRRSVPGGIGTYVNGLLAGLGRVHGEHPHVELWASHTRQHPDPLQQLGFPVVTSVLPGPLLTRAWDRGLGRVPTGCNVVHATSLVVPPQSPTPITVMVHDVAWRRFPEAFPQRGRQWHQAALKRACQRAQWFFTPTQETADVLKDEGVPPEIISIVDEGCDHLDPPDHPAVEKLLAGLGVFGPFLLAVGTLEPRKNLPRLFDAYRQARPHLPEPWPLVVVGPKGWGDTFTSSELTSGESAPGEGVILAGSVPGTAELAALYERCRLFVSVPLLEGFGLPVAEAMSMGAPVIASPVPSAGGATYEVDPFDSEAIAAAIVRVATDDECRADLIQRGRKRAAMLTWAKCAQQHLDVWKQL